LFGASLKAASRVKTHAARGVAFAHFMGPEKVRLGSLAD
jgi:hypothetical protein